MMANNYAMRDAALSQAGGDAAVFQAGQVAMIIQNSSRVSAFNAANMNYDVTTMPSPKDGQHAASAGGAAWVMSAQSDNKEAAAARQTTIEAACADLTGAPDANTVRGYLTEQLPPPCIPDLEQQWNSLLSTLLPDWLRDRPQEIAVDFHDEP
jgi:extracellular solute-binding protein